MQNWPIKSPARQHQANQDAQCHPEYTDNWDECPFRGELLPLLGVGNYVLLVLYSIESCARAFAERERFLCNVWNVIDLVTVLLGWMSLLLQNIINPNLLRLSRLVRVLRAARVFISIPEFYLLVSGLYSSFKAIIFGSFMLLSTIVVWAIIAVEVLHPVTAKLTFASEFCQGRECQLRFRSVYSAGPGREFGFTTERCVPHETASISNTTEATKAMAECDNMTRI